MIQFVKILPIMLLLSVLLCPPSRATSILNKTTLTDEGSRVQIFLRLSKLPPYSTETIGKRVDLVLSDTVPAKDFIDLSGNDKMIKMISKKHQNQLRLSFYFRYPPQNISVRKAEKTSLLMLDVLLGNPFSARYPDLASRLHGITVLNRDEIDYTNPIHASAYGDNWKLFIEKYENAVEIRPEQRLTLPPFPLAAGIEPRVTLETWLPKEIIIQGKEEAWSQMSTALRSQLELEDNEAYRIRLLLTYAESLVRNNQYREPHKLLQQISLSYPDTPQDTYAKLLFLYVTAVQGDPYLASIQITELTKQLTPDNPFTPYLNILQAELALETDRIEEATDILKRDNVAYTGKADRLRLLRQADTYYFNKDFVKSLIAYKNLSTPPGIVEKYPSSLARYGDTLYTHNRFKEAAEKYQILVKLLNGQELQHLAMFRLAMSRLHAGEKLSRIFPLFNQMQEAFPGTEGAYRSHLKQTDLYFLDDKARNNQTAREYGRIGEIANQIALREEALVKQAMVNALDGKHEVSLEQAMSILRNFRHGDLTVETRALILSQIADTLKTMISEKRYVAALVLAKKNRLLFARGWLDLELLYDLAEAYVQLGVYNRAIRAYQYILEVSTGENREQVYSPMLTALFESGQYALVEDYADRYFFQYADSPGAADIFLLRINALQKSDQLALATSLLDDPSRPSAPEIDRTASRIYFKLEQWDRVIALLETENNPDDWPKGERDYILAEALFQNGQGEESRPYFLRLQEEEPYIELAMFRLAELNIQQGDSDGALKQFQKLTEKGKDPRWVKMAGEEIKILQMEGVIPKP